ncbi:OmpA family protein [Marinilabiliaceae bacterium ANBcel2]|nr:OmpA family protein [Marinilabiliaceae bacterium ANBcel2]
MQKKLFLIWLLALTVSLNGQNQLTSDNRRAVNLYNEATRYYTNGESAKAIESLYEAIDRDPEFIEAYLVLGDIYNSDNLYKQEAEVLKKAVSIDSLFFPRTHYNIGVALYKQGEYEESIDWLEHYKWNHSDDADIDKVERWISRARFAMYAVNNPYEINLRTVGYGINSEYDEYWPSVTADEHTMVFTVLVPRNPELYQERQLPKTSLYFREDFYISQKGEGGEWQKRVLLPGDINTSGNEGAQTLSADGHWMFFTACGREDGQGSCDIYFSQRTGGGWSEAVNLGRPINTPYWESQPTFGADGKTLMFVSNRPGGRGGKDIWKATLQYIDDDGVPHFGDVVNLGSPINTSGDETSPFLHHDNRTLYFSSNGLPGMGGMDIFFSRKGEDGKWRKPVNLGYPINTMGDEIGLFINARGTRAYFSSDGREEEQTSKNIYMFDLPSPFQPEPVLYVQGEVYDVETNDPVPAVFELKDVNTGEMVVSTNANRYSGEFLVCLPVGGRYAFRADHPGYMFYSGHFDLEEGYTIDEPYELDIGLQPIKEGVNITLENIFFDVDSYQIQAESKVELDGLITFMVENDDVRIKIGGHTDNLGDAAYNQKLSENRAKAVYDYLISEGIDSDRLEYEGYGMNKPIADNDTDEGRAKNRRTEITIL